MEIDPPNFKSKRSRAYKEDLNSTSIGAHKSIQPRGHIKSPTSRPSESGIKRDIFLNKNSYKYKTTYYVRHIYHLTIPLIAILVYYFARLLFSHPYHHFCLRSLPLNRAFLVKKDFYGRVVLMTISSILASHYVCRVLVCPILFQIGSGEFNRWHVLFTPFIPSEIIKQAT